MSGNGYRLLGFAVWHGGRWYLRRKLPSGRALLGGALAVGVLAGVAGAARRAGG